MFCDGAMVFIYIYLDIARYIGIYYSVGPSYNKKSHPIFLTLRSEKSCMPRLVFFFSVQWILMNCSWFCGKPRQKYWAGVSKCIKIYQAQPNLLRISVIKSMIRVPSIALYYFIFFHKYEPQN